MEAKIYLPNFNEQKIGMEKLIEKKIQTCFFNIHLQISLENIIYSSAEYPDCLVLHKMLIPIVGFPTIEGINCQLITVIKYNFKTPAG